MDESIEEQVTEEIKEEVIMDKETETNKDIKEIIEDSVNTGAISRDLATTDSLSSSETASIPNNKLSFSEELEKINVILDDNQSNNQGNITENQSNIYSEFENNNENDNPSLSKLKIMDESLELSNLDIHNIDPPGIELDLPDLINDLDIEVLE